MTSHALPLSRTAQRERVLVQPAARRPLPADDPHRHVPQAAVGARGLADALRRPHVRLPRALRVGSLRARRRTLHAYRDGRARVLRRLRARLPRGLLQPRHGPGARAVGEGDGEVRPPLRLPRGRSRAARAPGHSLLLVRARRVPRRDRPERGVRRDPARPRRGRRQPRRAPHRADHVAADRDQRLRRRRRHAGGVPPERAHRRSEPPRHRARHPAARADAAVPPARGRAPAEDAARHLARVPPRGRARDALAQRAARPRVRRARARAAVPPPSAQAGVPRPARGRRPRSSRR